MQFDGAAARGPAAREPLATALLGLAERKVEQPPEERREHAEQQPEAVAADAVADARRGGDLAPAVLDALARARLRVVVAGERAANRPDAGVHLLTVWLPTMWQHSSHTVQPPGAPGSQTCWEAAARASDSAASAREATMLAQALRAKRLCNVADWRDF